MKKVLIMLAMAIPSLLVSGQTSQVTGTIISPTSGNGIESASVGVEDTAVCMLTGSDGKYAMEKKKAGFAVQVLTGDKVNVTKESNFVSSLSGKVAGVQIKQPNTLGGSANIIIRGYKSLVNSNQPLFVVNGVPFDNSIPNTLSQEYGEGGYDYGNAAMDINSDDIESITILKGAAASALYGSAANGVVLITTKKGRLTKGLGVHFNAGLMFSTIDRSTIPKIQKEYGAGYYGYFDSGDVDSDGNNELLVPFQEDVSWGFKFDPSIKVVDWVGVEPSDGSNFAREVPWVAGEHDMSYFFETGVRQNYNIAFDGCSERAKFRFSYTNLGEKGVVPNSKLQKNTFDLSGSFDITDRLTVESDVTYVNNKNKGRYGTGNDPGNPMQSLNQWFQTNVDIFDLRDYWQTMEGKQRTWNYSSYNDPGNPIYHNNIYWTRYKNYQNDGRNRLFGYGKLKWELTSWLSLEGRAATDTYSEHQEERVAVYSVQTSGYTHLQRNYTQTNLDLIARFSKTTGRFSFDGFAGVNRRTIDISSKYSGTSGGLVVPDIYALSNSSAPISIFEKESHLPEGNFMGSVSLGYNSIIYMDFTGRSETNTNKRSCFYPSVSTSFVISELPALKGLKAFPFIKLRLNYAETGNGLYACLPLIEKQDQDSFRSADLKSEKTKSVEAGLEAGFFSNRIGLDLSLYRTRSVDQIFPVGINPFTGYYTKYLNSGEIENKGVEIVLNANIIRTQKFSWDMQVNWFKNNNKVISLVENINNFMIGQSWDVSTNAAVNQPYGVLRGNDFVYTNGKRTVGSDGYYLFSNQSYEIIGCAQPDWNAGVMTVLSFNGFTFSGLVDISQGGDLYSVDMKYGLASGLYEETAGLNEKGNPKRDLVSDGGGMIYSDAVYENGQPNTTYIESNDWYSGWNYDNLPTAFHVYDASYIKLREISFGYTVPAKLLSKTPVSNLNISIVGRNLWIIHKNIAYYDPEAGFSAGNNQGVVAGAYPSTRTLGFNLSVDF